jgi:hypothetical protein
MYRIEYEIGLNEQGRPHIGLPEDYEQRPEDRFFALEITRYMLQDLLNRRSPDLDPQTISVMDEAERLLGQLGDEVAVILYEGMRAQGEMKIMMNVGFHVNVRTIEERDALPDFNIQYDDALFDRIEGLIVDVTHYDEETYVPSFDRYKLVGGITNKHWVKL